MSDPHPGVPSPGSGSDVESISRKAARIEDDPSRGGVKEIRSPGVGITNHITIDYIR